MLTDAFWKVMLGWKLWIVCAALFEILLPGNLYEIEKLQNMSLTASMINTFISSLIMDYDFESYDMLDFNANYMPSQMLAEYLGGVYKTELLQQQYEKILEKTILLDSRMINLNEKNR